MATQKPLVNIAGQFTVLPSGDGINANDVTIGTSSVEVGIGPSANEYQGPKSLMEFVYALSRSINAPDSFRHRAYGSQEKWNGSAWSADTTNWDGCLDSSTVNGVVAISVAEYTAGITKKRFVIDIGNTWYRPNCIITTSIWSGQSVVFTLLVESSVDNVTFTTVGTTQSNSYGSLVYVAQADAGQPRYWRLTFTTNQALTTGPLQISKIVGLNNGNLSNLTPLSIGYDQRVTVTKQLVSSLAAGTAPFSIASTTLVSNLNVQYLNGQLGSYYAAASSLASYQPLNGDLTAISGNTGPAGRAVLAQSNINQILSYLGVLPLTGGTLTGALTGTTGAFSSQVNGSLFVEKYTTFTPTTVGWYRVFTTYVVGGGVLRLYAAYNNKYDALELVWNSNGWGQSGQIAVTKAGLYVGYIVSQVRVTGNSADAAGYLDIYVSDVTSAGPISIYAYGPDCPAFTAPIVVGAAVGTGTTKTLSVTRGVGTTDQFYSSATTGMPPLVVASTTMVSNLNVQYLNGQLGTYYAAASSLGSYLPLTGGTLTGALAVSGALALGNRNGSYSYVLGGFLDLAWKKVADITLGTGTYSAALFKVDVIDYADNVGYSANCKPMTFFMTCRRSGEVLNDLNDAIVYGPVANYVRVVKTATGVYELQVRQIADWMLHSFVVEALKINNGAVTYASGTPSNGSTSGTNYLPTASWTQYLPNLSVAGVSTLSGHLTGTTAAFSGNVTIGTNLALHAGNYTSYAMKIGGYPQVDLNTLTTSGVYRIQNTEANRPNSLSWGQLLVMYGGADTITQIYGDYATGALYTRSGNPSNVGGTGVYSAWRTLLGDNNYGSYVLPLTGGTLSGHLLSGSGYQIKWSDGSLAAPGYSFYGETNTGIARTAAGTLALVVAGVAGAKINSAGIGVGVGTPYFPVHAVGSVWAVNPTYNGEGGGSIIGASLSAVTGVEPGLDLRRWAGSGTIHGTTFISTDSSGQTFFYNGQKSTNTKATVLAMTLSTAGGLTLVGGLTATTISGAGTGLTGTAASLSIGGTAGSIAGFNNPATAATANTIVYRDSSGNIIGTYGFFSYLNMSHGASGATGDTVFYSSFDDYIRKNNATGFRASLNVPTRTGGDASGTWGISVTGTATTATTLATPRSIYGANFDGSAALAGPIIGTYGGTGVNNGSATLTLGGHLIMSGSATTTLAVSIAATHTLPGETSVLAYKNSTVTSNRIPRWTGAAGKLMDGLIQDDGTYVCVGGTPDVNATFKVTGSTFLNGAVAMQTGIVAGATSSTYTWKAWTTITVNGTSYKIALCNP